jgi:hypothetical protein
MTTPKIPRINGPFEPDMEQFNLLIAEINAGFGVVEGDILFGSAEILAGLQLGQANFMTPMTFTGGNYLPVGAFNNGLIVRSGPGAPFADSSPTAAAILAANAGLAGIGNTTTVFFRNLTAFPNSFSGNTGVTVSGVTTIPAFGTVSYLVTHNGANTITMVGTLLPSLVRELGAVTAGHLAVFADGTGNLIQDGGAVPGGGGGAPGPYLVRSDATALIASTIAANTAAGNNRYVLDSATGVPITLPIPTGTGVVLEFQIKSMSTTNGYVFGMDTASGGNHFISGLLGHPTAAASAVTNVNATVAGNHNVITLLNGQAGTGGDVGDVIIFTDAIAGQYQVSGFITVDTTSATFSAVG